MEKNEFRISNNDYASYQVGRELFLLTREDKWRRMWMEDGLDGEEWISDCPWDRIVAYETLLIGIRKDGIGLLMRQNGMLKCCNVYKLVSVKKLIVGKELIVVQCRDQVHCWGINLKNMELIHGCVIKVGKIIENVCLVEPLDVLIVVLRNKEILVYCKISTEDPELGTKGLVPGGYVCFMQYFAEHDTIYGLVKPSSDMQLDGINLQVKQSKGEVNSIFSNGLQLSELSQEKPKTMELVSIKVERSDSGVFSLSFSPIMDLKSSTLNFIVLNNSNLILGTTQYSLGHLEQVDLERKTSEIINLSRNNAICIGFLSGKENRLFCLSGIKQQDEKGTIYRPKLHYMVSTTGEDGIKSEEISHIKTKDYQKLTNGTTEQKLQQLMRKSEQYKQSIKIQCEKEQSQHIPQSQSLSPQQNNDILPKKSMHSELTNSMLLKNQNLMEKKIDILQSQMNRMESKLDILIQRLKL